MIVNKTQKLNTTGSSVPQKTPVNNKASATESGRNYKKLSGMKKSITNFFGKLFVRNGSKESSNSPKLNGRANNIPTDNREGGDLLISVLAMIGLYAIIIFVAALLSGGR